MRARRRDSGLEESRSGFCSEWTGIDKVDFPKLVESRLPTKFEELARVTRDSVITQTIVTLLFLPYGSSARVAK